MKKQSMQFSKKIVIAVTVAVTLISAVSIIFMWNNGQVQYMADVIKTYISYAMVVFISYSGNSAIQKALLSGKIPNFKFSSSSSSSSDDDDDDSDDDQNG